MEIFHPETKYLDKMKVELTQETNLPLDKIQFINNLSTSLKSYFENANYGEDIKSVLIGIICVRPEFDFFYKERSPKYVKEEKIKKDNGDTLNIINSLSYDIKLDYNLMSKIDKEVFHQVITLEILSSLKKLDNLPKKIKNFDKEHFKVDFENYFKERNKK
jgi:hypothetical protein